MRGMSDRLRKRKSVDYAPDPPFEVRSRSSGVGVAALLGIVEPRTYNAHERVRPISDGRRHAVGLHPKPRKQVPIADTLRCKGILRRMRRVEPNHVSTVR